MRTLQVAVRAWPRVCRKALVDTVCRAVLCCDRAAWEPKLQTFGVGYSGLTEVKRGTVGFPPAQTGPRPPSASRIWLQSGQGNPTLHNSSCTTLSLGLSDPSLLLPDRPVAGTSQWQPDTTFHWVLRSAVPHCHQ